MKYSLFKPFMVYFSFLIFSLPTMAQEDLKSYQIYNAKGKAISFYEMCNLVQNSDVLLFGESHNNSIVHWLQLELTMKLHQLKSGGIILGAEMFEADDQLIIDEYLKGLMDRKYFEKESKLWDNYKTDYKPMLDFAIENKLPFIATNVPRRYAHMVAHDGVSVLNGLDKMAYNFMAPLPFEADSTIPGYAPLYMMSHGSEMKGENFMYAQALKDVTMAYFISKHLEKNKTFIHYNGDYHSKNRGGIYWYLKKEDEKLKVMTISIVESDDMNWKDEYTSFGDFVIITSDKITRTY